MNKYLENLLEQFSNDKMRIEEILRPLKKDNRVMSFILTNPILAVCNIYLFQDYQKAKNHFYEAALANSYYHEILKYELFTTLHTSANFLLSDNKELIEKFCTFSDLQAAQKGGSIFYQMGKAIQHSILNDDVSLLADIEMIKKRSKSALGKNFVDTIFFFEGLMEKKEEKIFAGVNAVQKKLHRYQTILKDYFAFEATGLAKLAWMKGFEIDFKNKYIPQQLLPIAPLDHYESFDFYK